MLGVEGTPVIVDARQMAARLPNGYATESTVGTRLILVSENREPMVIACELVCRCQR
jgi:hypothetical protein